MFFEHYVPETTIYFIKNPQIHNFLFYGKMLTEAFLYPGKTNSTSDPNSCHRSPSSRLLTFDHSLNNLGCFLQRNQSIKERTDLR